MDLNLAQNLFEQLNDLRAQCELAHQDCLASHRKLVRTASETPNRNDAIRIFGFRKSHLTQLQLQFNKKVAEIYRFTTEEKKGIQLLSADIEDLEFPTVANGHLQRKSLKRPIPPQTPPPPTPPPKIPRIDSEKTAAPSPSTTPKTAETSNEKQSSSSTTTTPVLPQKKLETNEKEVEAEYTKEMSDLDEEWNEPENGTVVYRGKKSDETSVVPNILNVESDSKEDETLAEPNLHETINAAKIGETK